MAPRPPGPDSFGTRGTLDVGGRRLQIHRLDALAGRFEVARLPYSMKVLLENLLRHEDGRHVHPADVEAVASWATRQAAGSPGATEIAFTPERVLMQDFTGVPAVCDLAAMRDAMAEVGADPSRINPLVPVELVIDHSVIAEASGTPDAFSRNVDIEYRRNAERYQLLRWAQQAFDGFRVVPPGTGICHQVNLEYLARVVFEADGWAYPDTLVGTDSHTTMVNGLGVLGWGVGGIEAEAAMLGQPLTMLIPPVVGLRLTGELPEGSTATDLVLHIAQLLRHHGVVGKFVEAFGPGLASLPLENRATIGNMAPEYGATCVIFPVDDATLAYLRFTGRPDEHVALVEAYTKEQGLFARPGDPDPVFSEIVALDLSTVEPSLAGPARPQDRVPLGAARDGFHTALAATPGRRDDAVRRHGSDGDAGEIADGHVVIAAITSCTNTSNPQVMLGAGLLAKKALERGLRAQPWVKTSLAPGSRVVMDYLERAGLDAPLADLGFELVGFGCTTCIGNSGPLLPGVSEAVRQGELSVAAVLSGNRNFEGRIHPDVRLNYLASPPLVVAYALAGSMQLDLTTDPLGADAEGRPVHLRDIWPSAEEVVDAVRQAVTSEMFRSRYSSVFEGDDRWAQMDVGSGDTFPWDPASTYVLRPPFFEGVGPEPAPVADIEGARVLALLGDSVTTDHISPAGSIRSTSPAGAYLTDHGVALEEFNSYGARRGNHEVMMRGTFANVRLRNLMAPGTEGGVTRHLPDGGQATIFEAAMAYAEEGVPLVVVAGKEYGSGSSRDWAAKGTRLLGIRAVLAESFERIHRSNLVGMGVLPLAFKNGMTRASLGLKGDETFDVTGIEAGLKPRMDLKLTITRGDGKKEDIPVLCLIDTLDEIEYFRNGGILQYVLRQIAKAA
ncbi:MAG: aconitate hydratase AcnA [Acidobacteriota bacterium]|nr:aconitate hydratase AcnA [Acidobacteriota bacterium]